MAKRMAAIGVLLSLLGLPESDAAYAPATPRHISIDIEAANGSGCRTPNSVTAEPTHDSTGLVVTYTSFETRGGASRNCQLTVKVDLPANTTYALRKVVNRGYASLSSSSTARHTLTSYFTAEQRTLIYRHDIDGPYYGSWRTADDISGRERAWAPCDQASLLNINNTVRLAGQETANVGVTSTIFYLETTTCS